MRIDSLEVHKDIVKKVMEGRHLPDVFLETKFPDRIPGEKTSTYIKKTVSAVRRLVRKRMPEERGERVAYIADMLGLDPSEVVIEPLDRDSFAHQIVMGTCTVTNSADLIVRIPFPVHDEKYQYVYLHLYDKMKPSYHRTVRKYSRVEMDYIPVADLESYLAEHALLKAIQHYVSISHMFMPAVALALPLAAIIAQLLKQSLKETMHLDYVTLSRTKGYAETHVITREALPNAVLPTLTLVGVQFTFLIGGTVIIERLFSYEGLGNMAIDAVINRDLPLIQGIVLLFAAIFTAVNLLVDLLYATLNPRLRHG